MPLYTINYVLFMIGTFCCTLLVRHYSAYIRFIMDNMYKHNTEELEKAKTKALELGYCPESREILSKGLSEAEERLKEIDTFIIRAQDKQKTFLILNIIVLVLNIFSYFYHENILIFILMFSVNIVLMIFYVLCLGIVIGFVNTDKALLKYLK